MNRDPNTPRLRRAGRDQIIERAIAHELRSAGDAPLSESCLDHEAFAAWMDGGLDAPGVAAAEAHVASCARCREMVATLVRTTPSPEAGGAVSGARWWRWWLAPLAASAAAVTLWMVIPQQSVQQLAQREPLPSASAGKDSAGAPAATLPQQPASPPPAVRDEVRQNVPAAEPKEKLADADLNRVEVGKVSGQVEQPAKTEEAVGRRADAALMAEAEPRRQAVAREGAKPPVGRDAPAAAPAPAPATVEGAAASQLSKQVLAIEVVSPDASRRWRTAADGSIEHSEDGGRTWFPVRLGTGEALSAGASPSPGVCWFVGRRGVVLLAIDGVSFARLPFPESVDLVGVTAIDGRSSTVTAADGGTFQTTDSGRNWRRQ